MRSKLLFLFCLLAFPLYCSAANSFFTTDLYIGMDNIDVKILQQTLNQSNDTLVASSGPGSKGNETTYFGIKTKNAVIKFQEKYSDKILAPNGLSVGTGFVGKSTRAVSNDLLNTSQVAKIEPTKTNTSVTEKTGDSVADFFKGLGVTIPTYLSNLFTDKSLENFNSQYATTSTASDAKDYGATYGYMYSASTTALLKTVNLDPDYFFGDNWKKYPHIFSIDPKDASPGDKVVISGINLNDEGLVLTLDNKLIPFKKTADSTYQFNVPFDVDFGSKDISLKKDDQRFQKNPVAILIKKKNSVAPDITSIKGNEDASSISISDTIIIKGAHFEDKNDIITSFGTIKNVQSVTKDEIRFSLSDAPYLSGIMSTMKDVKKSTEDRTVFTNSIPVVFYVQNANGRSGPSNSINIKFQ